MSMVLKTRRAQDTRHIEGTTIEGIQCNSPDELADHHNLTKLSSHTQIHIQPDFFRQIPAIGFAGVGRARHKQSMEP